MTAKQSGPDSPRGTGPQWRESEEISEKSDYVYIKRVVGLPGETVFIEDEAIFINDEWQTPPGSLSGLKYKRNQQPYQQPAGTRRDPFRLGENEYFLLPIARFLWCLYGPWPAAVR